MNLEFKEYFKYDNGVLFIKKKFAKKTVVGNKAGCLSAKIGYYVFKFKGKQFLVHRVIWEMFNGAIPEGYLIDHINQNKTDNRIENLRLATKSQNAMNSIKRKGKSVFKGVQKNKHGKFESYIKINQKKKNLGTFNTETEAAQAYNTAAKKLFGEYASLNVGPDLK